MKQVKLMSDYTTIADVGETLIDLLRENMKDLIPLDSIVLVSPGELEGKDSVRLSLFLYQVSENPHMKNQNIQITDPKKTGFPPLNLDLHYMLTPHPSTGIQDKTESTKEEHSILGRAMQVFNDHAILKGSALRGDLAKNNEELHLTISPLSLDDMTKIWTTFQNKPFKPSTCYLVTPVRIESTREDGVERVVEKRLDKYMMRKKNEPDK